MRYLDTTLMFASDEYYDGNAYATQSICAAYRGGVYYTIMYSFYSFQTGSPGWR